MKRTLSAMMPASDGTIPRVVPKKECIFSFNPSDPRSDVSTRIRLP